MEVDFEWQFTGTEVKRTKTEGVQTQNETVDEWNEAAILHNET